jgi:hypothetical protein
VTRLERALKSGVLPDDLKLEGSKKEEEEADDDETAEPAAKQAKTA